MTPPIKTWRVGDPGPGRYLFSNIPKDDVGFPRAEDDMREPWYFNAARDAVGKLASYNEDAWRAYWDGLGDERQEAIIEWIAGEIQQYAVNAINDHPRSR